MNDLAREILSQLQALLVLPLVKLGDNQLTLLTLVKIVFWLMSILVGNSLLRRFIVQRAVKHTRFDLPLQYAVSKIIGYLFVALGFYIALQVNGVDLSSLAVIAGAIGVGLGFGLQNIISNFVSGLIILAERPIAIGDRVEVSGVAGTVTKISLRSTLVITNDNIAIIVPNSYFITQPVTNWSHGDSRVQMRLPLGVAYGTDVEKLRRVLLAVAAAHPKVLKTPEPSVYFDGFGDSALKFELGVWTSEMTLTPRRFRSELYFAIERSLRENQIEIPFPQRDLHLKSGTFVLSPPSRPT